MKLKSLLFVTTFIAGSSFASASTMQNCAPNMTGFTVQGGISATSGNAKVKDYGNTLDTAATAPDGPYDVNYSGGGKVNAGGFLAAGYQHNLGGAVLGFNVFGGLQNDKIKVLKNYSGATNALWNITVKNQYNYGFAFKAGYIITRSVLGYVTLGGQLSKLKVSKQQNANATVVGSTTVPNVASGSLTGSKSKTLFSPVVGVGTDIYLTPNLFLNVAYQVTFSGKKAKLLIDTTGVQDHVVPVTSVLTTTKYTAQQFNLGLGYKF